MFKKILLIIISMMLAFNVYSSPIKNNNGEIPTPEQLVKEFYIWYIHGKYDNNKISQYVSENLLNKIRKADEYGEYDVPANLAEYNDGSDYFLKIQDLDTKTASKTFKIVKTEITNDIAKVYIKFYASESDIQNNHLVNNLVTLKKLKGTWKIIKVKDLNLN